MSDDVAVLWLEPGEAGGREASARSLAEWARARGVRLIADGEAAPGIKVDLALAERAERELERAREAIGTLDADAADRALARAETLLRDHPELPQAAWLRAEVERTWSARFLRVDPRDDARARTAWENAAAIDGGRVAGVGETDAKARARTKTTFVVSGPSNLVIRLDGVVLTASGRGAYPVDLAIAEHQLLVTLDDRVVFASWIAVGGAEPETRIRVGDGGTCSREQLASAKHDGDRVVAPGVSCASWAAVLPAPRRGAILVARCQREMCGPLLEWRAERLVAAAPLQAEPRKRWPTWATVAIIGVGAVAAGVVTLAASGALGSPEIEPRFVIGGVRQQ